MTDSVDPAFDEALDWAIRIQDRDFDDWDAHAAWLARDAGNAGRYQQAVLALDDGLATVLAADPVEKRRPRVGSEFGSRSRWAAASGAGLAIAASVAALVFVPRTVPPADTIFRNPPGGVRHIRLPDGTRVAMNGDGVLHFANGARRTATLDRGQAYFEVVHDAAHPFTLRAGGQVFEDVGTAFDVRRSGDDIHLAVGEGAVAFDPEGANIVIRAGRSLAVRGTTIVLADTPKADAGAWRTGRLIFRDAVLSDVATELSQSLGEPVSLAPGLETLRFSGILRIERDHAGTIDQLTRILGLRSSRPASGWFIAK